MLKEIEKSRKDLTVLILGYAYDANSDDDRNTPTLSLIKDLEQKGIQYEIHDSYIKEYKSDINSLIKNKDALILMTAHDEYKSLDIKEIKKLMKQKPIIIDGRNVFNKEKAKKVGFVYKGIGNI